MGSIHISHSRILAVVAPPTAQFRLPIAVSFFHCYCNTQVERELGFAAHHAIHHLAMVKIIAETTLKLTPDELPIDFGKAPSTIVFERQQ
jgi:hypothetical protein